MTGARAKRIKRVTRAVGDIVAAVRKVVCSKCDHQYDPKESEYTVIFDWSVELGSIEDPALVVVLARSALEARSRAEDLLIASERDMTEDDFYHLITFHGDVTNLVAE